MRFFATEGGEHDLMVEPLRIVAEYVGGSSLDNPLGYKNASGADWTEEWCFSEEELLAKETGPQALQAWRGGDDSAHENVLRRELMLGAFEHELVVAGKETRPDLWRAFTDAMESRDDSDAQAALDQARAAGGRVTPLADS